MESTEGEALGPVQGTEVFKMLSLWGRNPNMFFVVSRDC